MTMRTVGPIYRKEDNQLFRDKFAARLRDLLSSRKETQVEICRKLDIPVTSFNSWMRGIAYPSPMNLIKLEKYFKVSLGASGIRNTNIKIELDNLLASKNTILYFRGNRITEAEKNLIRCLIEKALIKK